MTIKITIDDAPITGYSGYAARLLLDPEDRTLTVWGHVGAGSPESVWHHRARLIGTVTDKSGAALRAWCEANAERFAELADCYQGSQWDGHSHVGSWSDGAAEIDEGIRQDLAVAELPGVWDASDWFGADKYTAIRDVLRMRATGLDDAAIASTLTDEDAGAAILDVDDVEAWIERHAPSVTIVSVNAPDVGEDETIVRATVRIGADDPLETIWYAKPRHTAAGIDGIEPAGDSPDAWLDSDVCSRLTSGDHAIDVGLEILALATSPNRPGAPP